MPAETSEPTWEEIEPLLDEAVNRLGEAERTAVLLRYFENKSFREIGAALGLSEGTAQKRVSRALQRLRTSLVREGVAPSLASLAAWLPARTVQPAPDTLAGGIAKMLTSQAKISTTTAILVKGTMNMIAWTKIKFAAGLAAALVLTAGTATIVAQKTAQQDNKPANAAQRATPVDALRYLADAFTNFDGDRVADSFVTNSPAKQRMVLALSGAVSAEGRLRKAMEAKFGPDALGSQRPAFLMNFGQKRLDEAVAEEQGDVATVNIPGRNRQEPLRLFRTNGVWRIDDDDSAADQESGAKPTVMELAAGVADQLAAEVAQGRYRSANEVMRSLQQRVLELARR